MEDHENPAIYFMYGMDAILENFDAWIRWEYNRDLWKEEHREQMDENIDKEIMKKTYERVYEDFKNRNYYKLDLVEGENPETSDYSLEAEDIKKRLRYEDYKKALQLYEQKKIDFKPEYPIKQIKFMGGLYTDTKSLKQDNWNRNTHIGNRIIPVDRIKLIETADGRSDGLSIIIDRYDKLKENLDKDNFKILEDFINYAKEKYREDPDFKEDKGDFGRREIIPEEEAKYAKINKIEEIKKIYAKYNITKEDIEKAKEELENNVLEKEQKISIEKDKDIKEKIEIE